MGDLLARSSHQAANANSADNAERNLRIYRGWLPHYSRMMDEPFMRRRKLLTLTMAGLVTAPLSLAGEQRAMAQQTYPFSKTEAEWRQLLTEEQFYVLRQEGTEPPFRNAYHDNKAPGIYVCAGCGQELFASAAKYDSGTGWPSFWEPIAANAVGTKTDWKLFVPRTEVHCSNCGGHLGHVFRDGPEPTGLRYCMNSAALKFTPATA